MKGGASKPCVFCAIARGEARAHVIWDDEDTLAFLDARPLFFGHVLVVPRAHVPTLGDLPPSRVGPLFRVVQRVARAIEAAMEARGTFVAVNNRISQSVPHLHVHVVPRREKDGLRGFFWPRTKYPSDEEAAAIAGRIRAAVEADADDAR